MFIHRKPKQSGFTLIELLVVISIIGLLASVVLVSLNGARKKARDTRRMADLKQIVTALEMYNSDNGTYPNTNSAWACFDCVSFINIAVVNPNAASITAALSPYINQPKDPNNSNTNGVSGYLYVSNGTDYKLIANWTPENMSAFPSGMIDANRRMLPIDSSGQCAAGTLPGGIVSHNSVGLWSSTASASW